jgi:predicted DNA-binding protein
MSRNALPRIVRPAPSGSKRGWVARTTLLPPHTDERLNQLADLRGQYRVAVMQDAIERYLDDELPVAA